MQNLPRFVARCVLSLLVLLAASAAFAQTCPISASPGTTIPVGGSVSLDAGFCPGPPANSIGATTRTGGTDDRHTWTALDGGPAITSGGGVANNPVSVSGYTVPGTYRYRVDRQLGYLFCTPGPCNIQRITGPSTEITITVVDPLPSLSCSAPLVVGTPKVNRPFSLDSTGRCSVTFGNGSCYATNQSRAGTNWTPTTGITSGATAPIADLTLPTAGSYTYTAQISESFDITCGGGGPPSPVGSPPVGKRAKAGGRTLTASASVSFNVAAVTPPTVTLSTNPAVARIQQGQNMELRAQVSDPDGVVTGVEFLNGSTSVATGANAGGGLYTALLSSPAPGSYSITARVAYSGGTVSSNTVVFAVNAPPTVSITSPTNGQSFAAGAAITVNATGSDDAALQSLQLFVDGSATPVASVNNPAIGATVSLSAGVLAAGGHTLLVRATDSDGATNAQSISISVAAANVPPTVSIASPSNGQSFPAGSTITVSASSNDDVALQSLQLFVDGASVPAATVSNPALNTAVSLSAGVLSAGNHTLRVVATDNVGATGSATVTISVVSPNAPPTINIVSPANNSTFAANAIIAVQVTVTDDVNVQTLEVKVDGAAIPGGTLSNLGTSSTQTINTPALICANHVISVRAVDNLGAEDNKSITVTCTTTANTPPVVTIASPANNSVFAANSSIAVQVTATDDKNVQTLDVRVDGAAIPGGTLTNLGTNATRTINTPALTCASHVISVQAVDAEGAQDNKSITVTCTSSTGNTPPTVTITSPANGATFTGNTPVAVAVNITDNAAIARVELFVDGATVADDSRTNLGTAAAVTLNTKALTCAAHTLTVRATDDAGLVGSASIGVACSTVVVGGTAVRLISPLNGAPYTAPGSFELLAEVSNPADTERVEFLVNGNFYAIGRAIATNGYTFPVRDLPPGQFNYQARVALKSKPGTFEYSGIASVTVNPQTVTPAANQPPTVQITAPANQARYRVGNTISITANASDSDGTVRRVDFFVNGVKVGEAATAPYRFDWIPSAAGAYTLSATALDDRGAVATFGGVGVIVEDPNALAKRVNFVEGNNQLGRANAPLPVPLKVIATDGAAGVPGVTISWSVTQGDASIEPVATAAKAAVASQVTSLTTTTGADGTTAVRLVFGAGPGERKVRVCLPSTPQQCIDFSAKEVQSAVAQPAASVVAPLAQIAVLAPRAQLSNIRQRLEILRSDMADPLRGLTFTVDGKPLPPVADMKPTGDSQGASKQEDKTSEIKSIAPKPFGFFMHGDIEAGESKSDVGRGFKLRTKGVTLGADYRVNKGLAAGAAFGGLRSTSRLNEGLGEQTAKGYSLSLFGMWRPTELLFADAIINGGRTSYDLTRQQTDRDYARGSTKGKQFALQLNGGMIITRDALRVSPQMRVEFIDARVNGFSESGSEGLTISDQRIKSTAITAALNAEYSIPTRHGLFIPNARLEYQRQTQSNSKQVFAQLIGNDAQLIPVPADAIDKSFGSFALGVQFVTPVQGVPVSSFINYERLFGLRNFESDRVTAGFKVPF